MRVCFAITKVDMQFLVSLLVMNYVTVLTSGAAITPIRYRLPYLLTVCGYF